MIRYTISKSIKELPESLGEAVHTMFSEMLLHQEQFAKDKIRRIDYELTNIVEQWIISRNNHYESQYKIQFGCRILNYLFSGFEVRVRCKIINSITKEEIEFNDILPLQSI